uniref:Uncharacterized mitochondrial protein AtMg00810-like n=1 Tax=Tanacetum cinerariifolium TaxID=118510 RepID=A0A699GID0_TANCI|nr:uncharacterized mitochondrial protein AtMg00810-like [Tanacetum cinerariifolium]
MTKVIDHVSKYNSTSITLKKFDYGNLQMDLQDKGVIDSGCSRHMTGNMSYLTDYKEIDRGYATFGGNPKGEKITSKVLLRVPRKNNMYSVDLKNIVPKEGLTCLFSKSTSDESKLWHRRLGHLNFKTMNKLVKGNLVRGLPSKLFEMLKHVLLSKGKTTQSLFDHEDANEETDMNNMDATIQVSPAPTTRIHKNHPLDQIKEEVYVCQPLGFKDPDFPDKVYKVEKALYGLHQAHRAWYETLSIYLLDNGFHRGKIDKTLFIRRHKDDIFLIQVYVDDIIFGLTKKELCNAFEQMMHEKFQMSSMGELTFFLGLQVKQKPDIMFAVCACARYQVNLKVLHLHAMKRIFRKSARMKTERELCKKRQSDLVRKRIKRIGGGPRSQETMRDTIAQTRVESFDDNKDLGEDASKQKRINDIDADEGIALVSTHDDAEMFDTNQDLRGEEVFVAQQDKNIVEKEVDVAQIQVTTVVTTPIISTDEVTLAQELTELKHTKPKAKAKGIVFHEPEETYEAQKERSYPVDEEVTLKLQAKFDKEQRLVGMMFDRAFKRVNTFVDYITELVEESSKKAKVEVTEAELKQLVKIIPDEEGVAIDAIPLVVKPPSIVDWKIQKEGKKSYCKIIRTDGSSKIYLIFSHMLKYFDREDVETLWKLVKAKYRSTRPEGDYERVLWVYLKVMFDPHVEDDV